jgi:hypothetical protein
MDIEQNEIGRLAADRRRVRGGRKPLCADEYVEAEEDTDEYSEDGRDPRADPSSRCAAESDHQEREGDGEENQIHPRHIARDGKTGEEDKVADERRDAEREAGPELPVEAADPVTIIFARRTKGQTRSATLTRSRKDAKFFSRLRAFA